MRQLSIRKGQVTDTSVHSFALYLKEVSVQKLITADREVILAYRIKEGNIAAMQELVRSNLRFVISVAKQYQNQGLSLPDLINNGNIGLINAAKTFNPTLGFKFITHAVWKIRQSIQASIIDQSRMVRLPAQQNSFIMKIKKISGVLEQRYERNPTSEEIGLELNLEAEVIDAALKTYPHHLSIYSSVSRDNNATFEDEIENVNSPAPDLSLLKESLKRDISRALVSQLKGREQTIVCMFFGIGYEESYDHESIGKKLDLTRERVRQIKEKALQKLRVGASRKVLKQYLSLV